VNCGKPIYGYKTKNQRYCKICSVNIRLERVRLLRCAYYLKWKVSLVPVWVRVGFHRILGIVLRKIVLMMNIWLLGVN
jgi:hypothetical protein